MKIASTLLALGLTLGLATAHGQKVYKHVDERGNVTYSQTPPANDAKTISVPPPRRVPTQQDYVRTEEYRAQRHAEQERRQREYERQREERLEAAQESRRKQTEALRSECERNRGTDCSDPATLARMQAERGPSQYRPRVR